MPTKKLGLVLALFAVLSCKTAALSPQLDASSGKDEESSRQPDDVRTSFYDGERLYWLHLSGWGQSQQAGFYRDWQRVWPAKLPKGALIPGSRLTLEAADPNYEAPTAENHRCPAAGSGQKLYETDSFTLSPMGNKTLHAPKGSMLVKLTDQVHRFGDIEHLHLVSMLNDMSYLREALALNAFMAMSVPATRWTYVKVCIDRTYYGTYFVHERSDGPFYRLHFGRDPGPQYMAGVHEVNGHRFDGDLAYRGTDDAEAYRDRGYELLNLKGKPELEFKDLVQLMKVVGAVGEDSEAYVKSDAFRHDLETIFDAKGFLRWAAVNVLLGAWDNYYLNGNNYFLTNIGQSGTTTLEEKVAKPYFVFVPVDYDNVFGLRYTHEDVGRKDVDWASTSIFNWEKHAFGGQKRPLVTNLLKNKVYRDYYKTAIRDAITKVLNPQTIKLQKLALWERIKRSVYAEGKTPGCDSSRNYPFACTHTARLYANDAIYRWVEDEERRTEPFYVYHYGSHTTGGDQMRADGIVKFVERRAKTALEQLAADED